ncbi:MAG: copper resistance protein CopC [Candidatus Manganitrophus sp.]|nr:MAG: copper resistance protein CopC [Candidatus Manganitrophus sp.]
MLLLPFFLAVFWTSLLWAHAFPMRSEPRVGSEVKEPPSQVKIWFDGDLEPAFSSLKVIGPDGKEVDAHDAKVDEKEHNVLSVSVPKLPPGKYRVKWEVVAMDTHRTEGDFTFTIK